MNSVIPDTQTNPVAHLTIEGLGMLRNKKWLFRNISFKIPRGSFVAITGPSGAGKSSLLNCLAGILPATEGELSYGCQAGCFHKAGDFQERIGIVFQNLLLAENSSVMRNVLCGRLGQYSWWQTLLGFPKSDRDEAYRILVELGLGEYVNRRIAEVSGGEQQRAAVARALIQKPEFFLADEPVSNLDASLAVKVLGLLRDQTRDQSCSVLCVLHDNALVGRFADYILNLDPSDPEAWSIREVNRFT